MGLGLFAVAFVGSAVGLWLVSQITEALRPVPQTPETLRWAPDIPIGYLDVGGCAPRPGAPCRATSSIRPGWGRGSDATLSRLSPYLTEHVNRFGKYTLNLDRDRPAPDYTLDFHPGTAPALATASM
jgi:hypothetical protein